MLKVQDISFSYQKKSEAIQVLNQLDFKAAAGEHIAIIGESGSGKSTLLKLIYGEFDLDKGHIFWKDTEILGPKYNLVIGYDFMKYVAQEFDLMPYITVTENIGKYLSNFFPEEKKARVQELLEVVELTAFADVKVKTLSGGQKQRVALARALANRPEILLLDEPFSHIDNFQKQSLRRNIFNYLKENTITCIVATHDSEDVLSYADRILVLHDKKIVANDSPQKLFKHPETALIASFFGEYNILDSQILFAHQLQLTEHSDLKVRVLRSYFKGAYYLIEADYNGKILRFDHPTAMAKNADICLKILKR